MSRPIEMCNKCKQLKPRGRDVVGWGWIVCSCDNKSYQSKEEQDAQHARLKHLKEVYTGPVVTEPFKPVFE